MGKGLEDCGSASIGVQGSVESQGRDTRHEKDIVFSLICKAIDLKYMAQSLQILSAFQQDSLLGMFM